MNHEYASKEFCRISSSVGLIGILAVAVAASGGAQAQPIFQDSGQELLSFQGNYSRDVALGDLDGNGSIDAMVAQGGGGAPEPNVIWVNNGLGLFTESGQTVGLGESSAVALGDLDGDGDLDVWVGNGGEDETWINQGGSQGGTQGVFAKGVSIDNGFTDRVALGDLDGDLDLDAVVLGSNPGIWWNTNGGDFVAGPALWSAAPYGVALADLDGDLDLDIVAGGEGFFFQPNRVIWNDWNTSQQFLDGPELFMDGIAGGVAVANLDGDGLPDIFIAGSDSDQVWWNNGDGTFTGGALLGNENNTDVALADLDGDGDQDAVVARRGLGGAPNGYWLNDGVRTFTLGSQLLGNNNSYAVALADLNGDGQPDAFVANSGPNKVWLNVAREGARPGSFTDSGQLLDIPMTGVALGDVDQDGDLDVVTSGLRVVLPSLELGGARLWINQGGVQAGQAGVFVESNVRFDSKESKGVALGDLDEDGDLDVFLANSGANTVWINQGGAQGGSAGVFHHNGQQLGQFYSEKVVLADVDQDTDLDAIVVNSLARARVWVNQGRAQGGTPGVLSERILGEELDVPNSTDLVVGDVDADGDLDAILNDGSTVFLYSNQGGRQGGVTGEFAGVEVENSRVSFLRGLAMGDLDGDLDLDLYLAAYFDDNVWINQGGLQGGQVGVLTNSGQLLHGINSRKAELADLDGDGDLDAFVVGDGDSQTWTNDGTGVFKTDQTLGGGPGWGVALGDLDGDGDVDAFVASPRGGRIWLNNEPNQLPVMFYEIDLVPDPQGVPVYNWWGRGNVIVPFRLSRPADREISVRVQGRYDLDGHLTVSPFETLVFPPGTTLVTATLWPGEPGGRPGEIWNVYQGAAEIQQDRVRYTVTLSNLTAGVTLTEPSTFYLDVRNPDFGNRQCVLDGILSLMTASGVGGARLAGVSAEEPGTNDVLSLSTYRSLRDQVLASSPQGQYFIDLYEQVSPELLQTISGQSWLLFRTVNVVERWAPAFQALAEGRGDEVLVTPEMIAEGLDYLEHLRGAVSPGLEELIRAEQEALDVSSWADMTMNQALAQVESRRIPAAFTRVWVLTVGGDWVLHWWGETGLSYRILRSVGGLASFEPVGEWLPGSGAGVTVPINAEAGTAVFYQLEVQE